MKKFVKDGFNTYPSKQNASWVNENQILIGADFGEGSMNESGYPMQVKLWNRGEALDGQKSSSQGPMKKYLVSHLSASGRMESTMESLKDQHFSQKYCIYLTVKNS